ncbi:unnamed protein product [Psylliodes chrysocephalus]|uniref:HAT C-terminal dimerisation domain-containing protein n=1 Tax=Psylliodes chrysocephalus TaxID=3402493 RepID=A0A9P0CYR3_9CUCU|nr:unnamed protein product [Psylliodes chrysocephala]
MRHSRDTVSRLTMRRCKIICFRFIFCQVPEAQNTAAEAEPFQSGGSEFIHNENEYDSEADDVVIQQNELLTKSAFRSQCKDSENFDIDVIAFFQISCSKIPDLVDENSWKYEITKYFSEGRANSSGNVLNWWKRHEAVFPISKMARNFLIISAPSASIERILSRTSLTITKRRNILNIEYVRCLRSLNFWTPNKAI